MESGDVGCVATCAKRHLAGNAPGMTALVEVVATFVHRRMVALGPAQHFAKAKDVVVAGEHFTNHARKISYRLFASKAVRANL